MAAAIAKGEIELVPDLIVRRAGNGDAAGQSERLNARRDVDAVAEDVLAIDDHIADVDADAELEPPVGRQLGVALGEGPLDLDRGVQGADHARKVAEHAVAGGADDAAVVAADRLGDHTAIGREGRVGAGFVRPHQPAVAMHVGGQDRRELSLGERSIDRLQAAIGRDHDPGGRAGQSPPLPYSRIDDPR